MNDAAPVILIALVGMKHRGTIGVVAALPNGADLELVRETDNKFDPNAVQVWANGQHVGYLAAKQVRPIALAMDAKAATFPLGGERMRLAAKLHRSSADRYPLVEVIR